SPTKSVVNNTLIACVAQSTKPPPVGLCFPFNPVNTAIQAVEQQRGKTLGRKKDLHAQTTINTVVVIRETPIPSSKPLRTLRSTYMKSNILIIGAGFAGVWSALSAARLFDQA